MGDSVYVRGECFSLPLRLERTLTLTETAAGWHLEARDYYITDLNTEEIPAPWSWAAHPSVGSGRGRPLFCRSRLVLRLEGSGGGRLGNGGRLRWRGRWQSVARAGGGPECCAEPRIGDWRQTVRGPARSQMRTGAPGAAAAGFRIRVRFEATATPYFGFVDLLRGMAGAAGTKANVCGDGAATAPVDSLG